MQNLFSIRERVIVITGGTGVLGSVIASYLAGRGAIIVILGRREEAGRETVNKIRAEAKEAQFLANEVAAKFGEGIRVNAIAPGFFITEQNRALLTNPDGSYTQRGEDVIRQTPFKRMGKPEELCGAIHYLVSDASSFVTGTTITVDGGFNGFAM